MPPPATAPIPDNPSHLQAATVSTEGAASAQPLAEHFELSFELNGAALRRECNPRQTLLEFLRMELGLMGTKGACLEGECGSCTVLVNGRGVNSCLTLAPQVQGQQVTTIEGLAQSDGRLHVLQQKFIQCGAVQCGYCTPGLILAAADLLQQAQAEARPLDREGFLQGMEGNICRCTGYTKVLNAIGAAWDEMAAQEASAAPR